MNETRVELKQPFSSTLSQISLHRLSHSSLREQRSSQQVGCHRLTPCFLIKLAIFPSCFMDRDFFPDPPLMEQRSPSQHLLQPEQTVAEQLQQGAGMCSVLRTTGWWSCMMQESQLHTDASAWSCCWLFMTGMSYSGIFAKFTLFPRGHFTATNK